MMKEVDTRDHFGLSSHSHDKIQPYLATPTPGSRLGPYEILSALGMGEVYKAKDSRLERQVAIKVLPPAVAQAPDRLIRFEREAKAVAAHETSR